MTVRQLIITRKKLEMTQKQLSRLLRKHATFVCKLERGKRLFGDDLQLKVKKAFTKWRKR